MFFHLKNWKVCIDYVKNQLFKQVLKIFTFCQLQTFVYFSLFDKIKKKIFYIL